MYLTNFTSQTSSSLILCASLSLISAVFTLGVLIKLFMHFTRHKMNNTSLSIIIYILLFSLLFINIHNSIFSNNSIFPSINNNIINYIEGIYCNQTMPYYIIICHIHHSSTNAFLLARSYNFFKSTSFQINNKASFNIYMAILIFSASISSINIIRFSEPTIFYANDNINIKRCDLPLNASNISIPILIIIGIANGSKIICLWIFINKLKQIQQNNHSENILSQYYDSRYHNFNDLHNKLINRSFYSGIFMFIWSWITWILVIFCRFKFMFPIDGMVTVIVILLTFDLKSCECNNHNIIIVNNNQDSDNDNDSELDERVEKYLRNVRAQYYRVPPLYHMHDQQNQNDINPNGEGQKQQHPQQELALLSKNNDNNISAACNA